MTTKEDHEPLTAAAGHLARALRACNAVRQHTATLRQEAPAAAQPHAASIGTEAQLAIAAVACASAEVEAARVGAPDPTTLERNARRAIEKLRRAAGRLQNFGHGDAPAEPLRDVLDALAFLEPEKAATDFVQGSAARGAGEPARAGGGSAPQESAAELLGRVQRAVAELCARIERTENAINGTPLRDRHKCVINAQVVLDHLQRVAAILSDGLDGQTLANNPGGVPKPEGLRATARVLEAVAETIERRDFRAYVKANQAMAAHLAQPCEYLEPEQIAGWPSILRGVQ